MLQYDIKFAIGFETGIYCLLMTIEYYLFKCILHNIFLHLDKMIRYDFLYILRTVCTVTSTFSSVIIIFLYLLYITYIVFYLLKNNKICYYIWV